MDWATPIERSCTYKKQETMNQDMRNIEPIDDEINLWELLEHPKSGWKGIGGGGGLQA